MRETRKLSDNFSATGQIRPEDMAEVARLGFKAVVNNRPDGEGGAEQPTSAECRDAAAAAGLAYYYVPLAPQELTMDLLDGFREAVESGPAPVLAHCKSGARSALLWALVETCHNSRDIDAVLADAARQGYDLGQMRPLIEHFVARHNA